jgi:membrane-bound serine protease (ClpP class)
MRHARRVLRLAIAAVCLVVGVGTAVAQTPNAIAEVRLDGVVDPFVADYLTGAIEAAQGDDAPAVLLTIDTPGGLSSSMREITQAILNSGVPVICYVSPEGARAASAGAFILLSCPVAAMAPGTNVGAATPVGVSGIVETRKVTEDAVASIRSIAETFDRNADVAESFVRDATSISAEEALAQDLIDLIEPTTRALLDDAAGTMVRVGGGDRVALPEDLGSIPIEAVSMSPAVGFLHRLFDPNLAFIFFWLGLGLIVLELLVPGHIFSGTIGTALLILSIVSFGFLPVRLIGILLLIASVVFFLIELSAPSLGVWGLAGVTSLVLGGFLLYDSAGGVRVSPLVIVPVAAGATLFFGVAVSKIMSLRHLPPAQGPEAVVGKEGVVLGAGLEPEGVVRVAAEEWRARSPGRPLPAGTPVRVTALDGLVLTVEPLDVEHAAADGHPATAEGGNAR